MSPGIVNRILYANHYHLYHISIHQQLSGNDKVSRVRFCKWALNQIYGDSTFFHRVMVSDKATFESNDKDWHNSHYYSQNNPHWIRHVDNQYR